MTEHIFKWYQWIPAIIIGLLGGLTLFIVNIVLNKFVFKMAIDMSRTIVTAIVFAVVFTVISYQWDKKTKG